MSTVAAERLNSQSNVEQKVGAEKRRYATQQRKKRSASTIRNSKSSQENLNKTGQVAASRVEPANGTSYSPEPEVEGFDNKFTLEFAFIILGYLVGGAAIIVFGLDLLFKIPFWRENASFGITNVIAGLGLVYLSWHCHREHH